MFVHTCIIKSRRSDTFYMNIIYLLHLLIKLCALCLCSSQMQGAYLVADDIMDHSLTRRGKPCWYKQVSHYHVAMQYNTDYTCWPYHDTVLSM